MTEEQFAQRKADAEALIRRFEEELHEAKMSLEQLVVDYMGASRRLGYAVWGTPPRCWPGRTSASAPSGLTVRSGRWASPRSAWETPCLTWKAGSRKGG